VELIKRNIHMEHSQNLASMQISLEEDQNISDQKPDAFRVVCKKADVKIGECKVQDESVWVRGMLAYQVLYLTDETEKRLCNMEGEIPFEEKIYIKDLDGYGNTKRIYEYYNWCGDYIGKWYTSKHAHLEFKLTDQRYIVDVNEYGTITAWFVLH